MLPPSPKLPIKPGLPQVSFPLWAAPARWVATSLFCPSPSLKAALITLSGCLPQTTAGPTPGFSAIGKPPGVSTRNQALQTLRNRICLETTFLKPSGLSLRTPLQS